MSASSFRNSGMGMASVANCIGGACSPFVVQMTRVNTILPFAFMGGLSFVAAFFCWFLPETLGKKTPEVMEDAGVKQGRHIPLLKLHLLPESALWPAIRLQRKKRKSVQTGNVWRP